MPGYSCPVKERMMYSSVKATFCETIQKLGLDILKRVRELVYASKLRNKLYKIFS